MVSSPVTPPLAFAIAIRNGEDEARIVIERHDAYHGQGPAPQQTGH